MLWSSRVGIRQAELPESLLENVLLRHANPFLLAWRQASIELLFGPGNRLLIHGFDIFGPGQQNLVMGIQFLELMDIT